MAWPAFFGAEKGHALDFEFGSDQCVEIGPAGHDVSSCRGWRRVVQVKGVAESSVDFLGKEGDLSFIRLPVIEKAIATNSMTRDTLNAINLSHGMVAGRLVIVPEEVVRGRRIKMQNFHGRRYHAIKSGARAAVLNLERGFANEAD